MKVMMILRYYPAYLDYFYERHPSVPDMDFNERREAILDDRFGWWGNLSRVMSKNGLDTELVIVNDEGLQKKWAAENGYAGYPEKGWEQDIAMEQIRRQKPDVVWLGSMPAYRGDFAREASNYCRKVIVWIFTNTPGKLDTSGITTLITVPAYRQLNEENCNSFKEVFFTCLAFESRILDMLGRVEKKYDVTFAGGIGPRFHKGRAAMLAYLIENGVDISVFGCLHWEEEVAKPKRLTDRIGRMLRGNADARTEYDRHLETIMTRYKGQAFGLDMFRVLASSRLTVNIHGMISGFAGNYSGNMRMFEATGAGACFVTERTDDLPAIFEPDKEVLTFGSKEEHLEVIRKALENKERAEEIAEAGQKRTLSDYNFQRMFDNIRLAFEV